MLNVVFLIGALFFALYIFSPALGIKLYILLVLPFPNKAE